MYSFPNLEPICCSMFSSNCCFLTRMQIFQEAGQVVWYSHFLENFPQFVVIHTVKGFGIVNKAEIDVFLDFSCLFYDPVDVGNLISGSSAFSKFTFNIWKFLVHVLLKPILDCKRSVFIPKKGSAKERSNYCTAALISHASKVILKILQTRIQQYVNRELPDLQAGFRKGIGTRDQISNIHWIIEKARKFKKNIYLSFIDYAKALITTNYRKYLKRWEHQTTLPVSC